MDVKMSTEKATDIIIKYLTNQATTVEIDFLLVWLREGENQKIFDDLVKVHLASTSALHSFDKNKVKMQLLDKINQQFKPKSIFKLSNYIKIAAVLVIALGTWFVFQNQEPTVLYTEILKPKSEAITLEMEDGSIQIINLAESKTIINSAGEVVGSTTTNGLVYDSKNGSKKISYNTLKIPFGKKFQLQLADGTKVFLNSGTSFRFPTAFPDHGNRTVFLSGEVFFDVAKDRNHPFQIKTHEMQIEVLGTKFNVNSYENDVLNHVVLVEGKVALNEEKAAGQSTVYLNPGEKGTKFNGSESIKTEKVNVKPYIAWISGTLVFKNAKFEDMIKILERNYNVTIVVKNKALNSEVFNATFINESIESLLKHLGESYPIKHKIKDNIIYIE